MRLARQLRPLLAVGACCGLFAAGLTLAGAVFGAQGREHGAAAMHRLPTAIGHFTCYEVTSQRRTQRSVLLSDQFGSARVRVGNAKLLCNPASKEHEPITNRLLHLVCYELERSSTNPFRPRRVAAQTQFGSLAIAALRPKRLCVPSFKNDATSPANRLKEIDHFQCYSVGPTHFRPRRVSLADQFQRGRASVDVPVFLCTPVRKNALRVRFASAHLLCHRTIWGSAASREVDVRNQFGSERLRVGKPILLCLPALKRIPTIIPPPTKPPPTRPPTTTRTITTPTGSIPTVVTTPGTGRFTLGPEPVRAVGSFTDGQGGCTKTTSFTDTFFFYAPGDGALTIRQPSTGDVVSGTIAVDGTFHLRSATEQYDGRIQGKTATATYAYTRDGCTERYKASFVLDKAGSVVKR